MRGGKYGRSKIRKHWISGNEACCVLEGMEILLRKQITSEKQHYVDLEYRKIRLEA